MPDTAISKHASVCAIFVLVCGPRGDLNVSSNRTAAFGHPTQSQSVSSECFAFTRMSPVTQCCPCVTTRARLNTVLIHKNAKNQRHAVHGCALRVGFVTSNGGFFAVHKVTRLFETRLHNLKNRKWLSHVIDHCPKHSTKSSQTTTTLFLLLLCFISGMIVIMIPLLIVILLPTIVDIHEYMKDKRLPPTPFLCVAPPYC